ncbi:MAG: dihydroneopterin aldolase [Armatimonadota bacterium]|nr:dihydroneopterin aldolase [Armatimonadota bacterium]MDR7421137.1 dihydroneopterin aldolase [Armatimonadota bacterium]MDR7453452.1 dihydroneopterin aldolase [Armatimonadota bacterium]MDR7457461.1 dihydroneopterin aldolase [Armatimonadota bacterium]MDR7496117.1 dihydroneopterin aldolase [Armatimonadota bacterium]
MSRDRIVLAGMRFQGRHGVLPAERAARQPFHVDVEIETDLRPSGRRDDLTRTVDYRGVYAVVRRIVEGSPRRLVEALAEAIAAGVLALPRVRAVTVRVRKPRVRLGGPLQAAGVEIRRMRRRARRGPRP